ncbi:hypothetical protein E5288_WYG007403 [Bos mutus]|uniref:C2H2-type domain-containing protein n=1 Tax=Bos mutus TaxID=72004 RepID=A0A6B0SFP5_9CETA|nr:hypothetical protein [Bos mutus]
MACTQVYKGETPAPRQYRPAASGTEGYASSMSHGVSPQELGREPWVSDWANTIPALTREAQSAGSPGCWHGMEDDEIRFEQSISVKRVSKGMIPKMIPSSQKAHPCETCGPILRDVLHMAEHQETRPGQKLYLCVACGKQLWFSANFPLHNPYSGEKPHRRDVHRALLVSSCPVQSSETPFTTGEGWVFSRVVGTEETERKARGDALAPLPSGGVRPPEPVVDGSALGPSSLFP